MIIVESEKHLFEEIEKDQKRKIIYLKNLKKYFYENKKLIKNCMEIIKNIKNEKLSGLKEEDIKREISQVEYISEKKFPLSLGSLSNFFKLTNNPIHILFKACDKGMGQLKIAPMEISTQIAVRTNAAK